MNKFKGLGVAMVTPFKTRDFIFNPQNKFPRKILLQPREISN